MAPNTWDHASDDLVLWLVIISYTTSGTKRNAELRSLHRSSPVSTEPSGFDRGTWPEKRYAFCSVRLPWFFTLHLITILPRSDPGPSGWYCTAKRYFSSRRCRTGRSIAILIDHTMYAANCSRSRVIISTWVKFVVRNKTICVTGLTWCEAHLIESPSSARKMRAGSWYPLLSLIGQPYGWTVDVQLEFGDVDAFMHVSRTCV